MLELFYHLHFRNKNNCGDSEISFRTREELFLSLTTSVSSLFTGNICARCALRSRTIIVNENLRYPENENLEARGVRDFNRAFLLFINPLIN